MTTKAPICIMIRNRPQGADLIELLTGEHIQSPRRAFIGYPPFKDIRAKNKTENFQSALINLENCTDEEWWDYYNQPDTPYKRQITTNRNIVREAVVEGSILLIPRPDKGLVYCGTISGFELVDNPSWGEEYLALRERQGLAAPEDTAKKASHLMDVVQSFTINEKQWCEIPFSAVPVWIRKSFFGRATSARIHPIWDHNLNKVRLNPVKTMKGLMKQDTLFEQAMLTSNVTEVENRLLSKIGPATFEHLMVAILALEDTNVMWEHVGGSGDGGVDGLGTCKRTGKVVAFLQSKWAYHGEPIKLSSQTGCRVILSSLLHPAMENSPHFYGLNKVARLIIKHADYLPWAKLMRVQAERNGIS